VGWIAAVVFDGVIGRLGPLAVSGAIHTVLVLTVIAGFQALGPRTVIPRVAWMSLEPPTAVAPDPEAPKHRPLMPRPTTTSRAPDLRQPPSVSPPHLEAKSAESTPAQISTADPPPPEANVRPSVSSTFAPPVPVADAEATDATMAVPRQVVRHEGPSQDLSAAASGPGRAGSPLGTATAVLPPSESPGRAVTRPAELRGGYQVRPPYPPAARRRGIQGITLLRVHVETDGRVADIVVQQSAGHADLDGAAIDAVRQWRFEPARNDVGPVAMWVLIPVEFRLTDGR